MDKPEGHESFPMWTIDTVLNNSSLHVTNRTERNSVIFLGFYQIISKVCMLGAMYRQGVLQWAFVKIGDFINFKGFMVESLETRRSRENKKKTRKTPEK